MASLRCFQDECEEARVRWLVELDRHARKTILDAVKDDAMLTSTFKMYAYLLGEVVDKLDPYEDDQFKDVVDAFSRPNN